MGSTKALVSAEQFLQMPPQEGKRFELNEGALVEMTFPSFKHNKVAGRLYVQLELFLREHPLGEAFPSDSGYQLGPATVRGPDISFLRTERMRSLNWDSNDFDGAPDLAVEVVSRSDSARDLQQKVGQYLEAGAHTVWVIYPDTREIHIFAHDGSVRRIGADGVLEVPELLPGFSVSAHELFA